MPRSAATGESRLAALAQCAGCGLEADGRFTVAESWAWWVRGDGVLEPHCPECAGERFGHRTSLMDDLLPSARHPLCEGGGDTGQVQERRLRLLDVSAEVAEGR